MCGTCGCSSNNNAASINSKAVYTSFKPLSTNSQLQNETAELHAHLHHGHLDTLNAEQAEGVIKLEQQILARNDHLAGHNREDFIEHNIVALNLVSSPGSGKTTLLENTLKALAADFSCAVIEGDQQTTHDAQRIAATGVGVIQVNTGTGCHLEADNIRDAAKSLALKPDSFLFIENVGNLVCPALFDLGERAKVAILSVTEGADKPLKYPHMFRASDLMIINKIDLLPYVDFDVAQCVAYAKQVNPAIEVIEVSATKGQGMNVWFDWLQQQMSKGGNVHAD